ncbi:MAG: toll/interleukin-1 receptor domain-containing protein [Nitrososphaeraceae archaeon]
MFTDVNNIKGGDPWSQTIKENISTSDVFIIILTYAALTSDEVEKEVLQAQKDKKRIIPAKYRKIGFDEVPWGLNANQGIEFESKDELVTRLYEMIFQRVAPAPKPELKKNLVLALILSALIPGWGHWYLGFKVRALSILSIGIVLFLTLFFVVPNVVLTWIVMIGYWALQTADAYRYFNKLKSDRS